MQKSTKLKEFWSWWVIDSWKDAIDLAVKLATIFAIIVAANIFIIRPSLYIEASIEGYVNTENIIDAFQENDIPISSTIQEYMSVFNTKEVILDELLFFAGQYNPESTPDLITSSLNSELSNIWEKMSIRFLRSLDDNETTYTREEEFYIDAYHDSSYAIITVVVKNMTGGTIRNVKISFPSELELIVNNNLIVDLSPKEEITYMLQTKDLNPISTNIRFFYDMDNTPINTTAVLRIGVFFIAIWSITLIISLIYKFRYI